MSPWLPPPVGNSHMARGRWSLSRGHFGGNHFRDTKIVGVAPPLCLLPGLPSRIFQKLPACPPLLFHLPPLSPVNRRPLDSQPISGLLTCMNEPDRVVAEVSPEDFLEMLSGRRTMPMIAEGGRMVVAGSVDLSNSDAGRAVENSPECEILWDLFAVGCENLKSARCFVRGSALFDKSGISFLGGGFGVGGGFSAAGCKALRTVSGHIGGAGGRGDANLRGGGLVRLESDFSCEGDLVVEDCAALQALDCEVGGSVLASGSAIAVLGPAFSCGRSLVLDGCRNFHELGRLRKSPADVHLGRSGIREVGAGFSCLGDLILDDVPLL